MRRLHGHPAELLGGLLAFYFSFHYYWFNWNSTGLQTTWIYRFVAVVFGTGPVAGIVAEVVGCGLFYTTFLLFRRNGLHDYLRSLLMESTARFTTFRERMPWAILFLTFVLIVKSCYMFVGTSFFQFVHETLSLKSLYLPILLAPLVIYQKPKPVQAEQAVEAERGVERFEVNGHQFGYRRLNNGDFEQLPKIDGSVVEIAFTKGYIFSIDRFTINQAELKLQIHTTEIVLSDISLEADFNHIPLVLKADKFENLKNLNNRNQAAVINKVKEFIFSERASAPIFSELDKLFYYSPDVDIQLFKNYYLPLIEKQDLLTNYAEVVQQLVQGYQHAIQTGFKSMLGASASWLKIQIGSIRIPKYEGERDRLKRELEESLTKLADEQGLSRQQVLAAFLATASKGGSPHERAKILKATLEQFSSRRNLSVKLPADEVAYNMVDAETMALQLHEVFRENKNANPVMLKKKTAALNLPIPNPDQIVMDLFQLRKSGEITLEIVKAELAKNQ
ncbi:MAG: hypothetical protein H7Z72_21795 [Bacteroidetes bacterium]|nr:hypothetical protein [Fibrella sp.]